MNGRFILLLISCAFIFSSCTKQKKEKNNTRVAFYVEQGSDSHEDAAFLAASEIEAQLSDIPVPLNVTPLPVCHTCQEDEIMLGYRCKMALDDIVMFYTQQMERFGWKQVAALHGFETLLHFEKPQRVCAVSIRSGQSKKQKEVCTLVIASSDKQENLV